MRRLANTPEALVGLGILALLATMALTAPLLFPGDPLAIKGAPLLPPFQDWALPLGGGLESAGTKKSGISGWVGSTRYFSKSRSPSA